MNRFENRYALALVLLGVALAGCGGSVGAGSAGGGGGNSSVGGNSSGGGGAGSGGAGGSPGGGGTPTLGAAQIKVLSNRSDLISGDDALVEIVPPAGAGFSTLKITLGGNDITGQFAPRANGRVMGLVTGLALGANTLAVEVANGVPSNADITNFPNGGPVFSGPQVQPWKCQDGALDALCNQPAEYSFLYKSSDPTKSGLQPYDPAMPATDVASTTTDQGVSLPFIVRQERGYQDRDEYRILTLFQPGMDWKPWAPQAQWNHKLLVTHGGSCGTARSSGSAPLADASGTLPANPLFEPSYVIALGRGFAVVSTALANLGHSCNVVVQAESLMMAKERLVEQYGELRYTFGTGCSGGAITQQHVANAYPGIYQGIITMCAYPDALSTGAQFADLHALRGYFEAPQRWAPGVLWLPTQFADVEGHIAHLNAITTDELFFKKVTNPSNCDGGVPEAERYHPTNNPTGVRCGLPDYMINVLGPREPVVWSPMEVAAGRGFGGIFADNTGIQYGLRALQQGKITPAQFVDVNEKIGGLDIDFQPTPHRLVADTPALGNGYRSGGVNVTNHLDKVAIINFTGPDPGIAHDVVHAWWTRWRLDREQGHHDNHVMWGGPAPLIGDPAYFEQGLLAMDRWMTAVEADASNTPLPARIVANKPADVHDQCSNGTGIKLLDTVCPEPIAGRYETPRVVAGDVITADTMKCQLRPFSRSDNYGLLPFSEAQWQQLEALFADGVCDYSKPGVDAQKTIGWLSYQNAMGEVIYGGAPLPALPQNSRAGWAAPAFR